MIPYSTLQWMHKEQMLTRTTKMNKVEAVPASSETKVSLKVWAKILAAPLG